MSGIKRVHVIYKTHLDIGYTNMGQTVLDSYVQEHIPHAIDLALKINTPEHKKFIWTVGSFLVDYYKRHAAPEQLEKMDEAIRLGYFRWHGLAVTSHTELQSPEVLAYNLSVSRRLDRAYGVHTIAAKMTDVPGHTIALVRPLSEAGIRYLHIGVNPSSRVPRVPEVFRWRRDGHEVIVHYSAQYGQAISIPGFDEAL
ncbi:glycoside hydrolase family 38 N-terminal domain-containing protein, partial [Hominenteromicrobium sp.]